MMHLSHFCFQHVSPLLLLLSVLSKDVQLLSTCPTIHMSKENMKRAGISWDILGRVKTTEQGPVRGPASSLIDLRKEGCSRENIWMFYASEKKVYICTCVTGSLWSVSENPGIIRNWSLKTESSHCYFTYLLVMGSGMWDWASISSELWLNIGFSFHDIRATDGWKIDKVLCV